jgi:hypothetical protein
MGASSREPKIVLEELLEILGPLPFRSCNSKAILTEIESRIAELRSAEVEDHLLSLIEDCSQTLVGLRGGDKCAAIACVISEIEAWRENHPFWFGHL